VNFISFSVDIMSVSGSQSELSPLVEVITPMVEVIIIVVYLV